MISIKYGTNIKISSRNAHVKTLIKHRVYLTILGRGCVVGAPNSRAPIHPPIPPPNKSPNNFKAMRVGKRGHRFGLSGRDDRLNSTSDYSNKVACEIHCTCDTGAEFLSPTIHVSDLKFKFYDTSIKKIMLSLNMVLKVIHGFFFLCHLHL